MSRQRYRYALPAVVLTLVLTFSLGAAPLALASAPTATPTPAPATDRIFYLSSVDETFGDFYVMNSDGTGVKQLSNQLLLDVANGLIKTKNIPYDPYYMTKGYLLGGVEPSPDGRYMAVCWTVFIVDTSLGGDNLLATQAGLYIVDGNDYKIHTIPVDQVRRYGGIGWSADSKRLGFIAERDGLGQIDAVDVVDNFNVKPFIQDDLDKDGPTWSPDGKWMVYLGEKDGKSQLYRADADGKNPQSLTGDLNIDLIPNPRPAPWWTYVKHTPEQKWQPDWSPDSKHILFTSWQGISGAVYVLDVDGGNARQLVKYGIGAGAMWLDNQTVVYGSPRDGYEYYQLYRINVDGTGDKRLSVTDARINTMSPSTDKQHILFASDAGRAYVVNADGTDQHNIKFGVDEAVYWEPDSK